MKNRALIKLITPFLITGIIFTTLPIDVYAKAVETQVESEEVSDTLEIPFDVSKMERIEIDSVDSYNKLVKKCALDTWSKDKYVVLTNDIDFSKREFNSIPTFAGVFDGNGHTISNVRYDGKECYIGLFSKTQPSAVIMNVTMLALLAPAGKPFNVGGIVGANYGLIKDCKFEGFVDGYDFIGGIAGSNEVSGVIIDCFSNGQVMGMHYSGGIVGANYGVVYSCINNAKINTENRERKSDIADIKYEEIVSSVASALSPFYSTDENASTLNVSSYPVDAGGIVGYNVGEISGCTNKACVGYKHVGYNNGGICGRQSGYIHDCINYAYIYGRKDIGGIVGQAEPYISINEDEDIVEKLSDNISSLHSALDKTIKDSANASDDVSDRLNIIKEYTDRALSDSDYLSDKTIEYANGISKSANEASERAGYILDESGGVFDSTNQAMNDFSTASSSLQKAADDLKLEDYLNDAEKQQYDSAKRDIEDYTQEYSDYYLEYRESDECKNIFDTVYQEKYDEAIAEGKSEEEAKVQATELAEDAAGAYAQTQAKVKFAQNHGGKSYSEAISSASDVLYSLVINHASDIEKNVSKDSKESVDSLKKMAENLKNSSNTLNHIFSKVQSKGEISFPSLPKEYNGYTDSLVENFKSISDALGELNNSMSDSSDSVSDDLSSVNNKFNAVLNSFTDAIDDARAFDGSKVYDDESDSVCENSTQATIASCKNNGEIFGDINVGGIAGTTAREYEFDLESDNVEDSDDKKINFNYLTRCVLRQNKNMGIVKAQKSYAGGVVGYQELGTSLSDMNFAKVSSVSGDYVGGIAGCSNSTIKQACDKGILSGSKYVGGIAGYGANIYDCIAMPSVVSADSFCGAISGELNSNGVIENNIFVDTGIAGIDRVSFAGAAEPVSYEQLIKMENIPAEYLQMKVYFIINDECIDVITKSYKDTILKEDYPSIKKVVDSDFGEDFSATEHYIKWENVTDSAVLGDVEITGEAVRHVTTLASGLLRNRKQSVILVDGSFVENDQLIVTKSNLRKKNKDILESYELLIPDDGVKTHQIRYNVPIDAKNVRIYVKSSKDSKSSKPQFTKVDTQMMGRYIVFSVDGTKVEFYAKEERGSFVFILIGCAVAVILGVLLAVLLIKRNTKKIAKAE